MFTGAKMILDSGTAVRWVMKLYGWV